MKRTAVVLVVAAMVVAACTSTESETTTTTSTTTSTSSTTTQPSTTTTTGAWAIPGDLVLYEFAAFDEIPLVADTPAYAGPATPTSLTGVTVYDPIAPALQNGALRVMLEQQGFAVVADDARLFYQIYGLDEYDPYPVFVTTDAAYHVWHLAFDKVLRDAEEAYLLPALERMILGLVESSRAQRGEYADTPLADAADRAAQFYEAAATLLELNVGEIGPRAQEEVALAMAAGSEPGGTSPTLGVTECTPQTTDACVSYSLFKPRGHYTRSPALQRYFRAMSLLGQVPLPLNAASLEVAVMVMRPLLASEAAVADWRLLYEPTAFLVGAADDYTPFELAAVAADVTPDGLNAPLALADTAVLEEIASRLEALREVAINPERASLRVMGVRFTLDSYIIDQLIYGPVDYRMVASVRDVAAAFGSAVAYDTMIDDGYAAYDDYDAQLAEMKNLVSTRTAADWSRTVYDAWLYALQAIWMPHGQAFPDFMQTDAWAAKSLQTGAGSYAELKHDTILYTKQAIAEGGDGGELPPPPRHWVEPDPVVFARIEAAAGLLQSGMVDRGLISDLNSETLDYLIEEMQFLARIARDELAGLPISTDDNLRLGAFGGWLEGMWLNTSDLYTLGEDSGPDEDAALVADIMTSFENGALEVATGKIDRIYVLVPDDAGVFEVAMGGVYSFYEFWQDPDKRLNDEEWRAMLDSGDAPPRPWWSVEFLVD